MELKCDKGLSGREAERGWIAERMQWCGSESRDCEDVAMAVGQGTAVATEHQRKQSMDSSLELLWAGALSYI